MGEEPHAGRTGGGCSRLAAASHLQTVPERRHTVLGNAVGDGLESSNTEEVMLDDSGGDQDAPGTMPKQEEAVQGKRTSSSLTEALLAADDAQSTAEDVTAQVIACTAICSCCMGDMVVLSMRLVCVRRHIRLRLWACSGPWTGRSTGALWAPRSRPSGTCLRACTLLWRAAQPACLDLLAKPR